MVEREKLPEVDERSSDRWAMPADDQPAVPTSDRFKRRMNRLFRERLGATDNIPHPEVDNAYERIRSRVIRCLFVMGKHIKKGFQKPL